MRRLVPLGVLVALACAPAPEFDPPKHPEHIEDKDGALHGIRLDFPFDCGIPNDPEAKQGVVCTTPVPDELRPCDASGCHGDFDFTDATRVGRDPIGSDGPSCYTCHGKEWKDENDREIDY